MAWLGFFTETRAGRLLGTLLLVLLASAAIQIVWERQIGHAIKTDNLQTAVTALRSREETDDEVERMPMDDRRRELAKWVR